MTLGKYKSIWETAAQHQYFNFLKCPDCVCAGEYKGIEFNANSNKQRDIFKCPNCLSTFTSSWYPVFIPQNEITKGED